MSFSFRKAKKGQIIPEMLDLGGHNCSPQGTDVARAVNWLSAVTRNNFHFARQMQRKRFRRRSELPRRLRQLPIAIPYCSTTH